MNTKPIPKPRFLELENASLKLYIMRRNLQDSETKFRELGLSVFESEQLSPDEWSIDLDRGLFVEKPKNQA